MLQEARIGKRANGGIADLRLTNERELVVAQGGASFQEAVENGHVYGVANQTGVTSQAGLSATTPVLTLYNPAGSGKKAVLWYAGAIFTVAFAAAAAIYVAVGTDTAADAVTGTLTTTHRNMKLGASSTNACKAYLAATLPAAPVAVSLLGAGLTGAITVAPIAQPVGRWFNGSIILEPGTNFSIQTSTASGASGTFCEYIWEEIDE
jgi:hypothetical protein